MSFQGNQGVVDPRVGYEIPWADNGVQVVQLTPVQIAQIVSNADTPDTAAQRDGKNCCKVQTPIKYNVPAFEGESTASWLTWSQRVIYQARTCSFEGELIAAEGDGLSVGADVFDSSNVDPIILRNGSSIERKKLARQKRIIDFLY